MRILIRRAFTLQLRLLHLLTQIFQLLRRILSKQLPSHVDETEEGGDDLEILLANSTDSLEFLLVVTPLPPEANTLYLGSST